MGVITDDVGSVEEASSEIPMDRSLSSFSLQDTLEIDEESLESKGHISGEAPSGSRSTTINTSKKRKNSSSAFQSFSYTNYWQLGELGSKNESSQ